MTTIHSYDGLDFGNYPYGVEEADRYTPGPRRVVSSPYLGRPGGALMLAPPGPRTVSFAIRVEGTTAADMEANKDALLRVLGRPYRRLVSHFSDARYVIAQQADVRIEYTHVLDCLVRVAFFAADDGYWRAPTPSTDVRTLSFSAVPNESAYRQLLNLTPGGSAPAPLRAILTNTGAVVPAMWQVRNWSLSPDSPLPELPGVGISTSASVAQGSCLVLDGTLSEAWVAALTNVAGWWPFEDGSGNPLDFSGNNRDLTAAGGVTYRQDWDGGAALGFDGSTGVLTSTDAAFGFTGDFSIGGWVYPTLLGSAMGALGKASATAGYHLRKTSSDTWEAAVGNGSTVRTATGITSAALNTWAFVVMTFRQSTGTLNLYVNGLLEAQTAGGAFTPTAGTNSFRVGSSHNPTAAALTWWQGRIAQPFAMSTVLGQTQIQDAMRRHLVAALASLGSTTNRPTQVVAPGACPLNPSAGMTNLIEVRLDAANPPTVRSSMVWRSRSD